jgi:hypothetical protein
VPLHGLFHLRLPKWQFDDLDRQRALRMSRQSAVNGGDAVRSHDELGNRGEAVGRDFIASDDIVPLEEDRFERLRPARRLHDDMRGLGELATRQALARQPSL